jgi:NADPH2:quinone reductase
MVKVIRAHRPGGPEVLQLEDIDLPAPGPGEVQLRHHAIGVNYIDVYRRTGAYPAEFPFVPGHEGAGEVIAVGEGVKEFQPGDRVAYVGAAIARRAISRRRRWCICPNPLATLPAP